MDALAIVKGTIGYNPRMHAFLISFLLITAAAFAGEAPKDPKLAAHHELHLGILAHIEGKDKTALKHFARCLKLAAPDSVDAASCRIYKEMFGAPNPKGDGASMPEARKIYKAAVGSFKQGDLAGADKGWHECLDLSETGTAARNDCLAALDLIPPKKVAPDEAAARSVYMEGFMFYGRGLNDKAAEAWKRCAKEAPAGSATAQDCQAGLGKLKNPY
jgi:hypothetical protein